MTCFSHTTAARRVTMPITGINTGSPIKISILHPRSDRDALCDNILNTLYLLLGAGKDTVRLPTNDSTKARLFLWESLPYSKIDEFATVGKCNFDEMESIMRWVWREADHPATHIDTLINMPLPSWTKIEIKLGDWWGDFNWQRDYYGEFKVVGMMPQELSS